MISALLAIAFTGLSIQEPKEPATVWAIEIFIAGSHEQHCYDDLEKALQDAHIDDNGGENLGDALIVVRRDQAAKALEIVKKLSKEEHFDFLDLTDPVVAESLEPRARHDDPVEFRRRVADFLKLRTDAPLPILIATSSFKRNDLPVLGDGVFVLLHMMEKAVGDGLHESIRSDIEDFPRAGCQPLKHFHSSQPAMPR